jgi:arsenite methyltransferase
MFENRYGIDAPGLVRGFFMAWGGAFAISALFFIWLGSHLLGVWLAGLFFIISNYALGMGIFMLYTSLVSKVRGREKLLDLINWSGEERVLDVGCGRGLLLVGAARRLTSGHATGIDLWLQRDQSSNTKSTAMENARIEGVAGRVSIETADMRELPFPDNSFDIILSSWAIHNLEMPTDRSRTLAEMVRVLGPGGTILLSDIANRDEYQRELVSLGIDNVRIVVASKWRDIIVSLVSFGAYRPAAVIGQFV